MYNGPFYNAENVFTAAIRIADEQDERTGEVHTRDTEEYRHRTLDILNILKNELWPVSETFEFGVTCPDILNFGGPIYLDKDCVQTIMPYGLAAHLLNGEDSQRASFFQQRYEELLDERRKRAKATWVDIQDDFLV